MRTGVRTVLAIVGLASLGLAASCNQGMGRGTRPPTSCTPDCTGRTCGDDGCWGSCGECDGDQSCNVVAGQCVGGDQGLVEGRLEFEYREGVVNGSRVDLSSPYPVPARNMWVVVTDAEGEVLGASEVRDAEGAFAVPTSRPLSGGERLLFTALWAPAPANEVLMAVLDTHPDHGTSEALPIWAWTRSVPAGGKAGTILVEESDGSAAMFLYLINRRAMESVRNFVLDGLDRSLVPLAILWAPGVGGFCGACYASNLAPKVLQDGIDLRLRQSIIIDDSSTGAGPWAFPVLLHEFGHYVAGNYSRDDSPGGPHYVGQVLDPRFAWSEGWASFFGAMTATQWFGSPHPVYWDIQDGDSFWMDFSSGQRWNGNDIGMPSLSGDMNQGLDESFVTMALWRLWQGRSGQETDDGSGLSGPGILQAISSPRFVLKDRGIMPGSDLVDFLDAAACADDGRIDVIRDICRDELHFPWDGDPLCVGRSPGMPLGVDLRVHEDGTTVRVEATAVARGPVPGPVRLEVRWPDRNAVGGEGVAIASGAGTGAMPLLRLELPAGPGLRVDAVATSLGPAGGATGRASWPAATARPAANPRRVPIAPVRLGGTLIRTAVSLDRE